MLIRSSTLSLLRPTSREKALRMEDSLNNILMKISSLTSLHPTICFSSITRKYCWTSKRLNLKGFPPF